jgi:hypothetical protein
MLLVLPLVIGCSTRINLPERPRLSCPEPEIVCRPGSFNQIMLDTSSTPDAAGEYNLAIAQVEGLNGEQNEFGLIFPASSGNRVDALATIRRSGRKNLQLTIDQLVEVELPKLTEATVGNEVSAAGIASSIGTGDFHLDTLYFAARLPGRLTSDYDLLASAMSSDQLPEPKPVRSSSLRSWDAQPALTPDGHVLFFASNRRGSIGGTDIYMSRRTSDGNWSDPENVGPGVNTTCDDLSPWVSGDGKWLYFSSSGHATVGGYDLFRAPIVGDQIGAVENLGKPINTPADELFPSAPATANPDTLLYYSSNQSGSTGFDMYVLHRRLRRRTTPVTQREREEEHEQTQSTGTVRNSHGEPVDEALVRLEEKDPPGRKDSTLTSRKGEYTFEVERGKKYEVTAESEKTLFTREEVVVPPTGKAPVLQDLVLPDTVTFRVNFPFNNATDPYEFTLDEHGMPSDLRWSEVLQNAAAFFARFNGRRDLSFEIVGHTDPRGTDQFNIDLGRRRAEFVRTALIKRGVDPALLTVRSEGESRPLMMHEDEPDELYRARLRRVELFRR